MKLNLYVLVLSMFLLGSCTHTKNVKPRDVSSTGDVGSVAIDLADSIPDGTRAIYCEFADPNFVVRADLEKKTLLVVSPESLGLQPYEMAFKRAWSRVGTDTIDETENVQFVARTAAEIPVVLKVHTKFGKDVGTLKKPYDVRASFSIGAPSSANAMGHEGGCNYRK